MAKYYVKSGDLEIACDNKSPKKAALFAFSKIKDNIINQLGVLTVVNEHGFDTNAVSDDDVYFVTSDLLDETDQSEDFQSAEWLE